MKTSPFSKTRRYAGLALSIFAAAGIAAAQDQAPRPWRSVNEPPPDAVDQESGPQEPPPVYAQQAPNYPQQPPDYSQQQPNYPPPNYPQQPRANDNYNNYNVPARLTIKPGTFVTVRVNQWLSSDRNQQGDAFTATLEQPLVVDGVVVAQRGQTVSGRVTEAVKAGRVEGTARLGVELTDLTFVDGQQLPIRSQMINRNGSTSEGRDAAAIGTTTALGAIIGAGADYGRGAAIGAGAGAAAGVIGVLLTRGRPSVIYPESVLTFRIDAPVIVATDRAPQAFRYADAQDYRREPAISSRPPAPRPGYAPAPYPPYAYAYPAPYYSGFSLYVGPSYGYFYGRGYRGGYRRR